MRETSTYLFQKSFCYGSEALILVPDQIHLHFEMRAERSEYQTAFRGSVDQVIKREQDSQAFLRKHGTVIGKAEGAFQMKSWELFPGPGTYIIFPALF